MNSTHRFRIIALRAAIILVFYVGWEALAQSSERLLFNFGSPSSVIRELWSLMNEDLFGRSLWAHFLITFGEGVCGMAIGTSVGVALGLATWFSRLSAAVVRPFVVVAGAMPVLAVAPLVIIWFGIGFGMKVALASLATVFIAFSQAARGAEAVSSSYMDVLKGMNATDWQVFVKVVIPGALDWVFNSMRLNAGAALLGVFIGEFIAANAGVGFLLLKAAGLYNTPRALACAFLICLMALIMDFFARVCEGNRGAIVNWFCITRYRLK